LKDEASKNLFCTVNCTLLVSQTGLPNEPLQSQCQQQQQQQKQKHQQMSNLSELAFVFKTTAPHVQPSEKNYEKRGLRAAYVCSEFFFRDTINKFSLSLP